MMRRLSRAHRTLFSAVLLFTACAAAAHGQSGGPYQITKPTVAGGSATSAGGTYTIIGTLAQHDAVVGGGGPYFLDGGFWPEETLLTPPLCATDVSAQVSVKPTGLHLDRDTGRYRQTVRLTNRGRNIIRGPILLVLDHLSAGVALFSPSGATACAPPVSPYVVVSPAGDAFRPDERLTVVLQFTAASHRVISYDTRVLAGGNR